MAQHNCIPCTTGGITSYLRSCEGRCYLASGSGKLQIWSFALIYHSPSLLMMDFWVWPMWSEEI